ncbi:MAG: hypothetical protein ACJ8M1_04610 [Chthoniobacterales bacterium]
MTRKLILPRHMVFHHDLHLLVFRPKEIITKKAIDKDIEYLERIEDKMKAPFNRFTDLSRIPQMGLTFEDVFRISLHRRVKYGKGPPVKSAFYVTTAETARAVRTHALLTQHSPLLVKMFEDFDAAAKWLGVASEDLQIGE